jgi:hypothetical protein
MKEINKTLKSICPWCGQPNHIMYVHRQAQFSVCGYNLDECCKGETCNQPTEQNIIKKEMK